MLGVRLRVSGRSGAGGGCGCLDSGVTSHLCAPPLLVSERFGWADLLPSAPLTSITALARIAPQGQGSAGISGRFRSKAAALPAHLTVPCSCKCSLGQALGGLPHHAKASITTRNELIIFRCFYRAQVMREVCVRCCQGQCCTRGSGRRDREPPQAEGMFRGASAELAAALQSQT